MRLNEKKFAEFKVSDIFVVKYGVNLELNACVECDKKDINVVNFVARTAENNGVSAYVEKIDNVEPQRAGLISIAGGGSVLSTFLQNEPFYSGRDLYTLEPKEAISNEAKLFIVTVIEKNKYKYSYGRQANKTLPDLLLKLPVDNNNQPDYHFMEEYIKSLHYKPITTKNKSKQTPDLNLEKWQEFRVGDLFPKKKLAHFSSVPDSEGTIPFISSTSSNNGVAALVDEKSIRGNCITVSTNGDCFDCFYQPSNISISSDVEALYNENINQYSAMFINTILMKEKYKWSYGRKPKNNKVYDTIIKLPVDEKGEPDWEFMENYIKSLPYGDRI